LTGRGNATGKMEIDIVLPKNNEEKFLLLASRLGIKALCFAYEIKPQAGAGKNAKASPTALFENADFEKLGKSASEKGIELFFGAIMGQKQPLIQGKVSPWMQFDLVIGMADSATDNRGLFERKDVHAVLGLESSPRRDFSHFRNSGLNHILCSIARKNNISVAFSFSSLLQSQERERSQLKGRISQNIRLCRKYGIGMIAASFASSTYGMRSLHDMKSLFMTLGMTGAEAKQAVSKAYGIIMESRKRKSPGYISGGIEMAK
jgi:RNase P/RNase MRP subunit p30